MKYMNCLEPELLLKEINSPNCGGCKISIKHSALNIYANESW